MAGVPKLFGRCAAGVLAHAERHSDCCLVLKRQRTPSGACTAPVRAHKQSGCLNLLLACRLQNDLLTKVSLPVLRCLAWLPAAAGQQVCEPDAAILCSSTCCRNHTRRAGAEGRRLARPALPARAFRQVQDSEQGAQPRRVAPGDWLPLQPPWHLPASSCPCWVPVGPAPGLQAPALTAAHGCRPRSGTGWSSVGLQPAPALPSSGWHSAGASACRSRWPPACSLSNMATACSHWSHPSLVMRVESGSTPAHRITASQVLPSMPPFCTRPQAGVKRAPLQVGTFLGAALGCQVMCGYGCTEGGGFDFVSSCPVRPPRLERHQGLWGRQVPAAQPGHSAACGSWQRCKAR